jgi:single-stranded-DNA-specific exonuclease
MAAGLTLHPDKMTLFRERLNDLARASLRPEQLQPCLRLDGEVSLSELTVDLMETLVQLGPSGMGNPSVQWMARGLSNRYAPQRIGRDQQHARLKVTDGGLVLDAVMWNIEEASLPEGCFDLAFSPQINDYNGRRSVQLKVLDWRSAVRTGAA